VGFYAKHILPHVIDIAMRNPAATRLRAEWIPQATGDVLEVGIGSGLNLPFYGQHVRRVYGLDPSVELQRMAQVKAACVQLEVQFLRQPAEIAIPLPAKSVDTVVLTWTLCSFRDPQLALQEIRRVMKTDARLIFIEHGSAPDVRVRSWQHRLTPVWKRIAGGCHLDRQVETILDHAGYDTVDFEMGYLPGPRPLTFTYRGVARPRGRVVDS
jgi:ubiquinone/menaquinone biosynthesis C-methylase UbiE